MVGETAEKSRYLEEQISKQLQFWINKITILGIFLFPLIGIADYFITPENFNTFIVYRLCITAVLAFLLFLNGLKRNKTYQYVIVSLIVISSAVVIELMILGFGGHASPYYAGMNLLIIASLGLIPFSFPLSISISGIIYAIYIGPILLLDEITNFPAFITNNLFMISTFSIALTWRILSQKSMVNELSLQYDLAIEKLKLEQYSTRLEHLVDERTRALSLSEQRYRALFDNANDGIAVFSRDGIVVDVNRRFCELHGFEKEVLIGTHYRLLEAENRKGEAEKRIAAILKGDAFVFETEHYKKDGSRILLEVSSRAIEIGGEMYIQSFHRDITEKKRLQEQLFQSQKMESIGALAGGIAHDFNNILTAILGHAELLHEFCGLDDRAKQKVKVIEGSARRAGQMVSKLLSFARKGNFEVLPLNLNSVVKDTVELLDRMMAKKAIELNLKIDDGLPSINGDSNQIEQVIMNLVVNAMDAMPGGGTISISTSTRVLDREATLVHPLLVPGRYAVLSISDTGAGIPEEIRDRIFDPFFTTKERGKGTGLGLAMVYGIVKEHKGVINVRSVQGKGSTFEIYLPASERTFYKAEKHVAHPKAGRENILVVDDEADILSFIRDVLESQGYTVLATDNPVYAQEVCKEIADDIDLVITDVMMPLVDGRELIRHFKKIKPSLRIIAISGFDMTNHGRKDRDIDAFIRKPFQGTHLLFVVRNVLDSERSASFLRRLPASD